MTGSTRPSDKSCLLVIGQQSLQFRTRETCQIESRRQTEVRLAPLGRVFGLPLCCESVSICSQSVTSCWKRNVIMAVRARKTGYGLVARRGLHHHASDRIACVVGNHSVYFGVRSSQCCSSADCRQECPQDFLHDCFHFHPSSPNLPGSSQKLKCTAAPASFPAKRPLLDATLEGLISSRAREAVSLDFHLGVPEKLEYTPGRDRFGLLEGPTSNSAHRPSPKTAGRL